MSMHRPVLAKSLVRPLLVERATELVEQNLLPGIVVRRVDDGALEQRLVEPLMSGVVLRTTGTVVDRLDAVLHQPHADGGEPPLARRAEGGAVVSVDDVRQAVLAEYTLEGGPGLLEGDARERVTCEQIPADRIRHEQRIAVPAVPEAELTLVVGRHHLARSIALVRSLRPDRSESAPDLPGTSYQAGALEDRVDGRARRPHRLRFLILQAAQDLLRSEAPLLPLLDQTLLDRLGRS